MKCIYCSKDSKFKERANGRCKHCQRHFAFEPTNQGEVKITDPGFQAAIGAVSGQGRLAFTARQLYYQALRPHVRREARGKRSGRGGLTLGIVLALLIFFACGLFGRVLPLWVAALIAGAIITVAFAIWAVAGGAADKLPRPIPRPPIGFAQFQRDYEVRWRRAHGQIARLLPDPSKSQNGSMATAHADELRHYSFDRLLVCDRAETAAFLLANNLHTETNTPIISVDGYPQAAFARVLAMVRSNPRLQVFVLHDADVPGCLLPLRLREDPNWFPQPGVAIIDIGLRPRQVAAHANAVAAVQQESPTTVPPDLDRLLTRGERAWLATGHRAELAAVPPERLLQTVYRAFTQSAGEVERQRAVAARDPRGFLRTAMIYE